MDRISYRGVRPSLDRIAEAARILGSPQNNYKIIHIAGTNGKGTVCHFISQLLAKSGYKVGMTLSPHVHDFRERIQIAANEDQKLNLISETDLLKTHEQLLLQIPESLNLTYYEWGMLLALQYFSEQQVEFAVVETGLGGRWDGSNICQSILSGITTIGYDHMQQLGDTKEKIVIEKLQIVNAESDFLFGPDEESLVILAKERCLDVGAKFWRLCDPPLSMDFGAASFDSGRLDQKFQKNSYLRENLKFALALGKILEQRGFAINFDKFLNEKNFSLPPARLEVICDDPHILLDGAHNEPGILALKQYLKSNYQDDYDLVFGCLNDRPFLKLARMIQSKHQNYWVRFDAGLRTTNDSIYEEIHQQLGGEVEDLSPEFITKIIRQKSRRPIVVCGSFYLCAQFYHQFKKLTN